MTPYQALNLYLTHFLKVTKITKLIVIIQSLSILPNSQRKLKVQTQLLVSLMIIISQMDTIRVKKKRIHKMEVKKHGKEITIIYRIKIVQKCSSMRFSLFICINFLRKSTISSIKQFLPMLSCLGNVLMTLVGRKRLKVKISS